MRVIMNNYTPRTKHKHVSFSCTNNNKHRFQAVVVLFCLNDRRDNPNNPTYDSQQYHGGEIQPEEGHDSLFSVVYVYVYVYASPSLLWIVSVSHSDSLDVKNVLLHCDESRVCPGCHSHHVISLMMMMMMMICV